MFISLFYWNRSHWDKEETEIADGNRFRVSVLSVFSALLKSLTPQVSVTYSLAAGYGALLLRKRLAFIRSDGLADILPKNIGRIAKRLCPIILWVGIEEATYERFFPDGESITERGQSSSVGLSKSSGDLRRDVRQVFPKESRLEKAPLLKDAVWWPSKANPHVEQPDKEQRMHYLCLQGWDEKNRLWKEAILAKDVMANLEEIETLEQTSRWGRVALLLQAVGYTVSVMSRFAHGLEVSPVEMIGTWMSMIVVTEVGILPLLAVPSRRGIVLHLDDDQFTRVVQYVSEKRHTDVKSRQLNCINLWGVVIPLLFVFFLFLILVPPLIYFYYKLANSVLSFVSIIPFALLAVAGVVAFCFMLAFPPHVIFFAFIDVFPTRAASYPKYMPVFTVLLFAVGLSSYILAIVATCQNWHLYEAQDHSFLSFIIPHIGS